MARKPFVVTDAMRERVRTLAGLGVPQVDIARIIRGDPKTLRKHFRDELDRGVAEANAVIAGALFTTAKGGNVPAQRFWLKVRAHWHERRAPEDPIPDAGAQSTPQIVSSSCPTTTEILSSLRCCEKHKRNTSLRKSGDSCRPVQGCRQTNQHLPCQSFK